MFRLLRLLIVLGLVVGAAVLAANHRGAVGIDWEGWHVDSSLAALCLAAIALGIAAWGVWSLITALFGSPFSLRRRYREKQRRDGYKALTLGMVAIAAGDGAEAKRHAKKARGMLTDQPLTLLLSAQAAQLDGDEAAARRHFEDMLAQPETEFLGLRGLFSIALKTGDHAAALAHAERAEARKPTAPWVLAALVELYERKGDWAGLRRVLTSAKPSETLDAASLARKRTLAALAAADEAERAGRLDEALSETAKALDASPGFVPALAAQARLFIVRGEHAKAAKAIERAWPASAHPDLASLYADTMLGKPALDQVKRFEKLAKLAPGAAASHLALAGSARAAKLWGEARRHFQQAAELDPAIRAVSYRGLAELEEAEHHDFAKAKLWLDKAADAPAPPGWRCQSCGAAHPAWSPRCSSCGTIDALDWSGPDAVPSAHPLSAVQS